MSGKKKVAKTSLSLNAISNSVIDAQNRDIQLYTEGHLNEANLWKSPEGSTHKTWETAKRPHLLMRPAHVFNKENVNEQHVTQMSDRLVEFSLSASLTLHKRNYTTPASAPKKDVYVEELKLPDLLIATSSKDFKKEREPPAQRSYRSEYFQQHKQQSLPRISIANLSKELPQSDIEIAYKMIHDPLNGVTKKEKLKNLKKFEENVIQKSDLTNSNVLYDTKKVRYLEDQLEDNLQQLNFASGANFHRLQVYTNCFNEIILDKNIFGDILANIKKEYDEYLYFLLDRHSDNNGSQLRHQANLSKSSNERRTNEIKKLDKENEELENYIIELREQRGDLNNQIEHEREFSREHEGKLSTLLSESTLSLTSNITKAPAQTIGDRIDNTKEIIMKKIKKMTQLNETLNRDYVPNVVISNLTQSIKDTEVEIQKLVKQNEFLTKQIDESELDLRNILLNYDSTEFAEENVDYLLKSLKILDVLQLQPNDKAKAMSDARSSRLTPSMTTINNNDEDDKKFYDDYFS